MNKKGLLRWLLALVVVFSACQKKSPEANFDIVVASDLHYITSAINDNGKYFTEMMAQADGKVSIYCEEYTDAFFDEVIRQKPEALILTGDITFSGAPYSHMDLAKKLAKVERAGVQVLVLPGNHDVYSNHAARFHGDSFTRMYGIETPDFIEYYSDFGYSEAVSVDEVSASYIYKINDDTMVLMLDMNTPDDWCSLPRSTLKWVEKVLRDAKKDGYYVLVCGHQNLMAHTYFTSGYVVWCKDELMPILKKYDVKLFLSGHLHMQHIREEDGITEIASSSLAVAPCQYGVLKAEGGKIDYHTQPVDVSAWAVKNSLTDENLLNWAQFARNYFDTLANNQIYDRLYGRGLTPEEKRPLATFYVGANAMYFSGDMTNFASLDPDHSVADKWQSVSGLRSNYIDFLWNDAGKNSTVWKNY